MHRLIKKIPGCKVYLTYAAGYEKENLRKIGFSKDVEKRKKNYVSSGNLINIIYEKSDYDDVDEPMLHSYFHKESYSHEKYKPIKRLKEVFYPSIEKTFDEIELREVYCQVFSDFLNLVKNKSSNTSINQLYLLNKQNKIDLKTLGLDGKMLYSGDYRKYTLNVWLCTEPLSKRHAGFWRSVIYRLGDNFEDIIKNAENLSNQTDSSCIKKIYNLISDKLFCIKNSCSLVGLSESSRNKVYNLYLSYCSTNNIDIRKNLESKMFDIINKSGHV